jgi:hypothetical protein
MKRRSLAAGLGIAVLAAAPAAALAETNVIGSSGQTSNQGVNSTQQGKNAVTAPSQVVLGKSGNTFGQSSDNLGVNAQAVGPGSPGGDNLIAAPGGPGFTQASNQGINSLQNGGRIQNSTNMLDNIQIVGDGFLAPTVLIGGVDQNSRQGVNSNQIGATSGHRTQNSVNTLVNAQIVSANVIIGAVGQANSQGVNSQQSIPSGKKATGTDIVGTGLPIVNEPGLIVGTPTGPVVQNSLNTTINAQLIFA